MPNPGDEVAFLTLRLYAGGAMGIEGNVGDVTLALGMLDSAREAVSHRLGKPCILEPHGAGLVLPRGEVAAPQSPVYPTTPKGDAP